MLCGSAESDVAVLPSQDLRKTVTLFFRELTTMDARWAICLVASLAAATAQVQVARKWRVAGPFAAGKAEREVDVLGDDGWPSDGGPPTSLLSARETVPS